MYQDLNNLPRPLLGVPPQAAAAPYNISAPPPVNNVEGVGEEGDDKEIESESDWSEADSHRSTSVTTIVNGTIASMVSGDDDYHYYNMGWIYDPALNLEALEELRGPFRSELVAPGAWTLRRFAVPTHAHCEDESRTTVRLWYEAVAESTHTPAGQPLRLPQVGWPTTSLFTRLITWEEMNKTKDAVRDLWFGREVGGEPKQVARMAINFLVPGARVRGLSEDERKRFYNLALRIWTIDPPRAEGLLWVMDKEFHRLPGRGEREWVNQYSEDFMLYTILYPPPIFTGPQ